jgi:hypothetical protein
MTERHPHDDWIEVSRSPKKTSGCGIAALIVALVAGLVFIPLLVIALAVVLWASRSSIFD